jgi:uncharacterized protein GlcG (DUF336 family)
MRIVSLALLVSGSLLATAAVQAQPLTDRNISMGMAMAIMQGTLDQCTKDGYKVTVVIVDKAGNVMASIKGDGTNPHTMEFAKMKAYTARTRGQSSLEFMEATASGAGAMLRQIPGVVAIGGGVPVKMASGETIGAAGASGAPGGEKDDACVKAGIAKVADQLK